MVDIEAGGCCWWSKNWVEGISIVIQATILTVSPLYNQAHKGLTLKGDLPRNRAIGGGRLEVERMGGWERKGREMMVME